MATKKAKKVAPPQKETTFEARVQELMDGPARKQGGISRDEAMKVALAEGLKHKGR